MVLHVIPSVLHSIVLPASQGVTTVNSPEVAFAQSLSVTAMTGASGVTEIQTVTLISNAPHCPDRPSELLVNVLHPVAFTVMELLQAL